MNYLHNDNSIEARVDDLLEVVSKTPQNYFHEQTTNLRASKMNLMSYVRIKIEWNERIYDKKTAIEYLKSQVIEKKLHQCSYNLLKAYCKIFYA